VKLFLIAELICLFFTIMPHIPMTAKDMLMWLLTDDDISYAGEQKHESGEDVVVPAIGQSIQAEQQFSRRGHQ